MPFFVNRGPGLDLTAEETRRLREQVLGQDVELQRRNPFLRELQGLGHFATGGLIPLGKRYEDFPGGRIIEEELSPEQHKRLLSMTKAERAMAIGANPTDIFRYPDEYRKLLLAPEPSMQSAAGKRVADIRRLGPGGKELLASETFQTLSPEQTWVRGTGEVVASTPAKLSDLARLNQEFLRGELTPEQFRKKEEMMLTAPADQKRSNLAVTERDYRLGLIPADVYNKWKEGVGKPSTSISVTLKEQEKAATEKFNLARATHLIREAKRLDAKAPAALGFFGRVASSLGKLFAHASPEWGQSVTEGIARGQISRRELLDFQKESQSWAISNIKLLTGEETGRISEPERELAMKESEVVTSIFSDPVSVISALETLTALRILNNEILGYEQGKAPSLPTSTTQEMIASYRKLVDMGYGNNTAAKLITRLSEIAPRQ